MIEIKIKDHQGAALMIFVLIMVMASSAFLLQSLNLNFSNHKASIDQQVLEQAKEALLGFSLSYADRNPSRLPGYLPCPDFNGDGISDTPCGLAGESSLGRLPWQTLGLKPLRDSAGECLWYAVSGVYKESPISTLSIDSNGQFLVFDSSLNSLNGNNASETAIAVVFAPGIAINNQVRSVTLANATECGSNIVGEAINLSANYLDNFAPINNATGSHAANNILGIATSIIPSPGISTFIQSGFLSTQTPSTFNDTLVKISPVDFQPVYRYMQQWIGTRVRECLVAYAINNGNKLPWPAILQLPGALATTDDNDGQLRFGRIANSLLNSVADAGISPLWPVDPDPTQAGTQCFAWGWWNNNADMVFVAIDNSIAPLVIIPSVTTLTVDGNPTPAAIFIAGRANFLTQNRTLPDDQNTLRNYMESNNIIDLGTGIVPPGNEDFITNDNLAVFFNDYVCSLNLCP